VAAILLREAGCCVLHGAAVARGGQALALLGPSGAGKSTLATALIASGAAPVTDDLVAVWPGRDTPTVASGPNVLSLDAEAARRFAQVAAAVRPRPFGAKTWVRPRASQPAGGRIGLDAVVLLAPFDDEPGGAAVTTLAPREAMISLLRSRYGAAWIGSPNPADLEACARIAEQAPVRCLRRPRDLAALEATVRSLGEHGAAHPDKNAVLSVE
jgi:hypothetical protein